MTRVSLAAALLLVIAGTSHAQESMAWKQTIAVPKGQNISRDRADILGIEFGDTYTEAKAKLEQLATEGIQPERRPKTFAEELAAEASGSRPILLLEEEKQTFRFKAPGQSQVVTATFVAKLKLERKTKGATGKPISEYITVHLSAPASAHQVVGMERSIHYPEQEQPRISDVLAQLRAKFKTDPQVFGNDYVYQFSEGQPYAPPDASRVQSCHPGMNAMNTIDGVKFLNRKRDCDVVLFVTVNLGISQDHASVLSFTFADNERIKSNSSADYAYVENYIRSLQETTRGAPPKL